ncbi:hypothetical protein HYT23_06270 [Candidatus Pacearchaeota archaeon]|nr:hypothetical protein [Candidatus Pacearchaeota archaeon]
MDISDDAEIAGAQPDLEDAVKNFPLKEPKTGPRTGGLIITMSYCCQAPVVQSQGAHKTESGMMVGGVIVRYCSKCHKPYHPRLIGGALSS